MDLRQQDIRQWTFISVLTLLTKVHRTETSSSIHVKYEKHFQKMYEDVGMAVPKTTETRCKDGSVQTRHVIQRLHN